MHKITKILILLPLIFSPFFSNSNELNQLINETFPNQKLVFGVKIIGTENTPSKSIKKASSILKQWLDNDNDGNPDNQVVIESIIQNNGMLIMGKSESDFEDAFDTLIEIFEEKNLDIDNFEKSIVGLISNEPNIAYLEETLHLVTQVGYANAYPKIFGEFKGSQISKAMDIARGGYFENTPTSYPKKAWYHYNDKTCDYSCMITEYFYWSLTSLLGAQKNRFEDISDEWELNTPQKMKKDVLILKLFDNSKFKIPTTLPKF